MDVKTIESLARLMKETGLTSLKLSEGETSLKLERLPMGGIALAEAPAAAGASADTGAPAGMGALSSFGTGVFATAPRTPASAATPLASRGAAGTPEAIRDSRRSIR